jgi:hypothetical protein
MPTDTSIDKEITDELIRAFYQEPLFKDCQIIIIKETVYQSKLIDPSGRVLIQCHGDTLDSSIQRMFRVLGFHESLNRYKMMEERAVQKMPFLVGKMELLDKYATLLSQVPDNEEKKNISPSFFWDIAKVQRGIDYLKKKYFAH